MVTITGADFAHATAVKFGTIDADSFKVESPTVLTAVAPPNALVASPRGQSVDVTVISGGGASAAGGADRFFYSATAEPWAIDGSARVADLGAALREAELGATDRAADEAAQARAQEVAAAAKASSEQEAAFSAGIRQEQEAEAARLKQEQAAEAADTTPPKPGATKQSTSVARAQELAKGSEGVREEAEEAACWLRAPCSQAIRADDEGEEVSKSVAGSPALRRPQPRATILTAGSARNVAPT